MSRVYSRYGSLSEESLSSIVRSIHVDRRSGVLYLTNENVSKRLYFNRGSIVFAGSDDDEDGLGEVLVREGRIKRSDLELAWQVMRQTGRSLEETIMEMELLSPVEIEAQGVRRRKAIILSSFGWGSGKYRFKELDNPVADEMVMQISTVDVILEGIRLIPDLGTIRAVLGDLEGNIRRPPEPVLSYQESSLTSQEMVVLDIAGTLSDDASKASDLVAISPLSEEETLRCLCSLVSVGALEMTKPSSLPRQPAKAREPEGPASGGADNLPYRLGRYEVQRLLGRGSMGTVFLARDPAIERVVAIKLIQTATFLTAREQERYRNRFRREAKAAGRLIHPGIVTVFDIGHADQESPFIVMEYVEGQTLAASVQDEELPIDETVRLADQILEALGYAHSFGIVHRDIKLANIMVTPGMRPKIMDFGIAHVVGTQLSPTEQGMGSPNYMAPEQLSKGTIDQRTDLFAFGVVLYRLLTGKLPFTGDSFASAAQAILSEEPESPDRINPEISPALAQVVLRCLAKDAEQRFASAEEVQQALASDELDRAHATFEAAAPPVSPPTPKPPQTAPGDDVHTDRDLHIPPPSEHSVPAPSRPRRRRLPYAALGAPLLLGLLALAFFFAPAETPVAPPPVPTNSESSPEPRVEAVAPYPPPGPQAYPHLNASELYATAQQEFEEGELDESKAKLIELIRRDPEFAGAPQLLVRVEQQLLADSISEDPDDAIRSPSPPVPREAPVHVETNPSPETAEPVTASEADLFYEATLAREQGDFETSKARLEELLERDAAFAGASDLLVEVEDEIWRQTLPLTFQARHRHRIGGCTGSLSLGAGRISYSSDAHDWRWDLAEIRIMEKTDDAGFLLETFEKDILGMGKPKRYRFDLGRPLDSEAWTRYQRLATRKSLSGDSSDQDATADAPPSIR